MKYNYLLKLGYHFYIIETNDKLYEEAHKPHNIKKIERKTFELLNKFTTSDKYDNIFNTSSQHGIIRNIYKLI